MLGSVQEEIKVRFGASIPVSTDQMVINNEVTICHPQYCSDWFKFLLGSGLVSWACLGWRFGLTTKGLHFQITADSSQRTYRPGGPVVYRTGVDKLLQQPGRAGLDYQKSEAKIGNLSTYMVPQYVFLTFFVLCFLSKMELLLLFLLHHTLKVSKGGIAEFWNSSPQFQIFP